MSPAESLLEKPAAATAGATEYSLLQTRDLVKTYGGRTVVNKVNIEVGRGQIVGLLGPNGAGKTTSFYMVVGLVPPNSGRVIFNGDDVTTQPMFKRARRGMGYLPQEESIFRRMTVEENLLAILQTQLTLWTEILERKSAENPLFKEIVESQKAFAERAVKWDQDTYVSRRMAVNHFFGAKKAEPKKA